MENKLDKLETEREFLLEMCPKDKRDTYDTGKECTLVRILLRTLPAEYDQAVKSVRDMMKLRKYGAMGDMTKITNKEDNTRTNYDDEWLPPYDELRIELVNSFQLQERRRKDLGKQIRKHPGHPVLPILPGHEQPGPHQRNCFGCGMLGHLKGDPACKAGPNEVWKGAPSSWKARRGADGQRKGKGLGKGKGKGKGGGSGKGKGKAYQRNLGDRRPASDLAEAKSDICHNWSRGNGYCKYGPNCNYKHEGPQGGKKRSADAASLLTTGGTKKARKKLVSLLVKDLSESLKQEKRGGGQDSGDEDAHVYKLIRGAPTVMITREEGEGKDYRLNWDKDLVRNRDNEEVKSINAMNKKQKRRHVDFSVILMMNQNKAGGGDYTPKDSDEDGDEEGQPVSAPGAETSPRSVSTPSPPSLEHFKGGFKLPKQRVPKKNDNDDSGDDSVVHYKNRNKVAVLTGGTYPNRNSMAVPVGSRVHTAPTASSSNPSVPVSRGESRSYQSAKRERPSDRRKSRLIKEINAKASLEGYPPLPETIEEFRRDHNLYVYHPMWDSIEPEEYFQWVKGREWSETQHVKIQGTPDGKAKGTRSDQGKHESSSVSSKKEETPKAPPKKGEKSHSKGLETVKAQAKEEVVHEIEVKDGGTACPPDRDDDILMVLKIKGKGTKLAYVDGPGLGRPLPAGHDPRATSGNEETENGVQTSKGTIVRI
jgi:hypothetical protein